MFEDSFYKNWSRQKKSYEMEIKSLNEKLKQMQEKLDKVIVRYYQSQVCSIQLEDDTHQLLPYIVMTKTDQRRENSKYGSWMSKEYHNRVKE